MEATREELLGRFRGLQFQPHTVLGFWIYDNSRFEDEVRRITVDVEDTPENHEYFVRFKQTLLERFEQIEIYIVSYPIDLI